jgi:hypothetical protein
MVACYTTVFQALMDVGRLEKGQVCIGFHASQLISG